MHRHLKAAISLLAAFALALAVVGCAQSQSGDGGAEQPSQDKGPITVGSKIDTEGELLASVIQLRLEDEGFRVEDKSQTGATNIVRDALLTGEIDIYPEYTGNGLVFFDKQLTEEQRSSFTDGQKGYDIAKELDAKNDVVWLTPAKANNTWSIATRKDFAEKNGLKTMSDFAAFVSKSTVKIAGSDEFFNAPEAMPSFERTYGFKLTDAQKLVFAGGNTAQTEKAVADGTENVNFAMAYGTDGALADLGLVVLEDDKGAQPVYWPTPIIRKDVLDEYPEIEDALAPAFEGLTLEKLQELNARIQVNGEAPEDVARSYLEDEGLIGN